MEGLDTYNEHNPLNPINEIEVDAEIVPELWGNLTYAYDSGHEEIFRERQSELIELSNEILYCLESIESGLSGKMRMLIEKLK